MKNLKIADDVHRFIRIEAAQKGEAVFETADRLLRTVLKMSSPEKPAAKKGK